MAGVESIKEDLLTCCICTDIYTDPCTLNCQHSFCRHCVTDYIKTRPECIQAKVIPCAFCLQSTPVPNPTRPVAEWAKQQKPSLILVGLMDRILVKERASASVAEATKCCQCEEVGETTPAESWCSDCLIALCRRCTTMHIKMSPTKDHIVKSLGREGDSGQNKKTHGQEMLLICRTCNQLGCRKCQETKHPDCSDVVNISSLLPDIKSARFESSQIQSLRDNQTRTEKDVQKVMNDAVALPKQGEEDLLGELNSAVNKKVSRHQIVANSAQISVQMLKQHLQFIEQILQAQSDVELYQMYQVCEKTDPRTATQQPSGGQGTHIEDGGEIRLVSNMEPLKRAVGDLCKIVDSKAKEAGEVNNDKGNALLNIIKAEYTDTIYCSVQREKTVTIVDVTTCKVKQKDVVVAADSTNSKLKSIYQKDTYQLELPGTPHRVAKVSEQRVVSTVSNSYLIVADVLPELSVVTSIKTDKQYLGLAVLSGGRLVVGQVVGSLDNRRPSGIDIIKLDGTVLRSFSCDQKEYSFIQSADFISITSDGKILMENPNSMHCITPLGKSMFKFETTGAIKGIAITQSGEILLALKNRILLLTPD